MRKVYKIVKQENCNKCNAVETILFTNDTGEKSVRNYKKVFKISRSELIPAK